MRGAWIEMLIIWFKRLVASSLPVRGAWIEILYHGYLKSKRCGRSL